ncbi:MAG TPA: hypothetical protein VHR41_05725 [Gemmatimonadales bacterium]|jgi:hypothetical protein|nr:hypothetical protein [Gemmatimonadales bacterium]
MNLEQNLPQLDPAPWLPLLRRLTQMSSSWCVWKNVDRALAGFGDIDSASIPADRERLLREFREWASSHDMGPIFVCHHLPGSVLGIAVRARAELIELQLCEQAFFRGAVLFAAHDLAPLMEMDERGFRRLRPGSEGLLLLFYNSMKRGGRPLVEGDKAARPLDLMKRDPKGVELAARLFGSVRAQALRVASCAMEGRWDRGSALRVELWAMGRGPLNPVLLAARLKLRAMNLGVCPLLPVLSRGRRLQGNVDEYLRSVARTHEPIGP